MSSSAHLIKTLKAQHADLKDALSRFAVAIPTSAQVAAFGKTLVAHLELEDARFYPAFARQGLISEAVASIFKTAMFSLVRSAKEFTATWGGQEPHLQVQVFTRELRAVRADLGKRIENEESTLYPLFLPNGEEPEGQDGMAWSKPVADLQKQA